MWLTVGTIIQLEEYNECRTTTAVIISTAVIIQLMIILEMTLIIRTHHPRRNHPFRHGEDNTC